MPEPDTQELDLAEQVVPGRHRAPASGPRRVLLHLTVAALGVLLATGLGALAADRVGLSDLGLSSQDVSLPSPESRDDEPRPQRAAGAVVREQPPAPEPAAPSPEPQAPAAAAVAPAPEPDAGTPSPEPVPTVRTGDSCPDVGRTGVTARGEAAVCTASPGHGPNKWRAA